MKAATDRSFTAAAAALSLLAATLHAAGLASAAFHTGDVAIIQQTQMNLTDLDCNVKSVALVLAISLDAGLAFILLAGEASRKTPYPSATLIVASNSKVDAVKILKLPASECALPSYLSYAQMAVGPATGKGSKKMYPVHVLWLCAKKGGELQLNTPTDMALAAAELLTTYSYMPATGHTALLSQVSVHGLTPSDLIDSLSFVGDTLYGANSNYAALTGEEPESAPQVSVFKYDAVAARFQQTLTKSGTSLICGFVSIAGPANAFAVCQNEVVRLTEDNADQLVMYDGFLEDMIAFAATSSASAEVYVFLPTPSPTEPREYLPLSTVKVFSKASNKQLREFEILWCLDGFAQPVVVP